MDATPCSTHQAQQGRTVTRHRLTVLTAWDFSRRRWSLKSVMSRTVTRLTVNGSLLLEENQRANLRTSCAKARRVSAAKSLSDRNRWKKDASSVPTGTPSKTLSPEF